MTYSIKFGTQVSLNLAGERTDHRDGIMPHLQRLATEGRKKHPDVFNQKLGPGLAQFAPRPGSMTPEVVLKHLLSEAGTKLFSEGGETVEAADQAVSLDLS